MVKIQESWKLLDDIELPETPMVRKMYRQLHLPKQPCMRIAIKLPDHQLTALAVLSQKSVKSRAALIRLAVDMYLRNQQVEIAAAFGLRQQHGTKADGLAHQQRLRAEWLGN